MVTPPNFPNQQRYEEFLETYRRQQEEQEARLRHRLEDFREDQKIGIQKYSLIISMLALLISAAFGAWNARIAYRSLAVARRGFVVVKLAKAAYDESPMVFEVRATSPNPALHVAVHAACATYAESGRQPEQVEELQKFETYETNVTLGPGDFVAYTCYSGTSEGMRVPRGIIQKAIRGKVTYKDLAGSEYFTEFCFKRPGFGGFLLNDFVSCPNANNAD